MDEENHQTPNPRLPHMLFVGVGTESLKGRANAAEEEKLIAAGNQSVIGQESASIARNTVTTPASTISGMSPFQKREVSSRR
jgi:hypothetical protein